METPHVRAELVESDRADLPAVAQDTGFFNAAEVDVVLELVDDRLTLGQASDYLFQVAELDGAVVGFACYGEIPATDARYDLYWLVVRSELQGRGLGRLLLERVEQDLARRGARRLYVETSSRPQYEPTRGFYLGCGYAIVAELPDFYRSGDGKTFFLKTLAPDVRGA